ncbi:uncharacterized protein BT62DRAFT_1012813 [Guyanagaster necrorhizus]|uniref:Uncharacterized protein n=1 Tax=Guyanagaster necrorhizus TaxID=856835 RepID=A0A9P8ALK8_9AGAR|nr:uncharacterized protein BT62DRAFT_1012813 [Guyanagaster necrorhizus MCA 3950]KAG7440313.1 hypothetical protein BT62DRAFT_1012813 [Guyanagaster necrorhizus MCA 3950]
MPGTKKGSRLRRLYLSKGHPFLRDMFVCLTFRTFDIAEQYVHEPLPQTKEGQIELKFSQWKLRAASPLPPYEKLDLNQRQLLFPREFRASLVSNSFNMAEIHCLLVPDVVSEVAQKYELICGRVRKYMALQNASISESRAGFFSEQHYGSAAPFKKQSEYGYLDGSCEESTSKMSSTAGDARPSPNSLGEMFRSRVFRETITTPSISLRHPSAVHANKVGQSCAERGQGFAYATKSEPVMYSFVVRITGIIVGCV